MKKSVGIITYHGHHNYGAMLQAFALQKVVEKLGYNCEIINFRTNKQKYNYRPAYKQGKTIFERLIKEIFLSPYKSRIISKYNLFEFFLSHYLKLSGKEYNTLEELLNEDFKYDYYISGSDQIWNPVSRGFNWAYYLPFVKTGIRIAYAPSMVQKSADELENNDKLLIKRHLENYDFISVREKYSANNLQKITGYDPEIVLDPTLLLSKGEWESYINNDPIINGEYLFFYTPWFIPNSLQITKKLSKLLNIKIVSSIVKSAKYVISYPDIKNEIAVGPLEFLNLCKNAKIICGRSLHLTAFSILLNKPFFITDGMDKKRIEHLLTITGLNDRSITEHNFEERVKNALDIDFTKANHLLKTEREKSMKFLINALK